MAHRINVFAANAPTPQVIASDDRSVLTSSLFIDAVPSASGERVRSIPLALLRDVSITMNVSRGREIILLVLHFDHGAEIIRLEPGTDFQQLVGAINTAKARATGPDSLEASVPVAP